MKFKADTPAKKYFLYTFFLAVACMLAYFLIFKTATLGTGLSKLVSVLNPIIYGFVIAYVLNPQMQLIENGMIALGEKLRKTPGKKARKAIRVTSSMIAVLIALLIIYALVVTVVPQLIESIRGIIVNFPQYVRNVTNFIDSTVTNKDVDAKTTDVITEYGGKIQQWLSDTATPAIDNLLTQISSSVLGFVTVLKNLFLGFIISIYMLISKETLLARFHRMVYALFKIPTANRILQNLRFVDEKFGGFLIGKIIDSAIIGCICYVCMLLMKMPYPVLISVFVGVTNIIPFFGPFIGAIPSVILIFVVNPLQALYFIIFIFALQQFDGNFLGPKILGNSVGISSFMVVVSIIIGSGFFGFVGMIIGVPLFAVLSAIIQTGIIGRMHKKKLPTDLEAYHDVGRIRNDTHEVEPPLREASRESLYARIKRKTKATLRVEYPLEENSWDVTYDQIQRKREYTGGNGAFPNEKAQEDTAARESSDASAGQDTDAGTNDK